MEVPGPLHSLGTTSAPALPERSNPGKRGGFQVAKARSAVAGGPRSRDISKPQMRVPPVPRIWGPGMPQTSTRNSFAMLPVNPLKSAFGSLRRGLAQRTGLNAAAHPNGEVDAGRPPVSGASLAPRLRAGRSNPGKCGRFQVAKARSAVPGAHFLADFFPKLPEIRDS
jgi:hypothetical protein